jgi:hypothetical protein
MKEKDMHRAQNKMLMEWTHANTKKGMTWAKNFIHWIPNGERRKERKKVVRLRRIYKTVVRISRKEMDSSTVMN